MKVQFELNSAEIKRTNVGVPSSKFRWFKRSRLIDVNENSMGR